MVWLSCGGQNSPPPAAASNANTTSGATRQQNVISFIQAQHAVLQADPDRVFKATPGARAYPSEAAVPFFAAYQVTGSAIYNDDALRQTQYARQQETPEHFLPFPADLIANAPPGGVISSLAQTRLALGYYVAYKATGNAAYVQWADDVVDALLSLQTTPVCWQQQCFPLYNYLYALAAPHAPASSAAIDPNQNAFHGLTMALLFAEPNSRHYHDAQLHDMAQQQLDATIVMMDGAGRLPLSSEAGLSQQYDVRYGSVALFLLHWANKTLAEGRYDAGLKLGAAWLDSYNHAATTVRYYPSFFSGPVPTPAELYYRLPLVLAYGGDRKGLEAGLDLTWSHWQDYVNEEWGWVAPFPVLEAMGIAQAEYWK